MGAFQKGSEEEELALDAAAQSYEPKGKAQDDAADKADAADAADTQSNNKKSNHHHITQHRKRIVQHVSKN